MRRLEDEASLLQSDRDELRTKIAALNAEINRLETVEALTRDAAADRKETRLDEQRGVVLGGKV